MSIKWKIGLLASLLLLVWLSVEPALALNFGLKDTKMAATEAGYSGSTNETTFSVTIGYIIAIALSFVGAIFLLLMVYAGYLWMTARGEEDQVKKAQKIITGSVIGVILTVGAYSVTTFIVPNILESSEEVNPKTQEDESMVSCCRRCWGDWVVADEDEGEADEAGWKKGCFDSQYYLDVASAEECTEICVKGGYDADKCEYQASVKASICQ
ncbi:MAG TPA: hypothetical protein VJB37_00520 [Patescibacteria group bacterium]|nr:hypothetical protein [Patescibacteria group bacterium]